MTTTWLWLSLVGLGAFHGLNPAMGWLFAVGLGLQHKSRLKVIWSVVPIALGHAFSIAVVVTVILILRDWIDVRLLQWIAATALIGFGAYRLYGRHRAPRSGMQAGFGDLFLWSFLSATGHGAGLMLLPVLLNMPDHSAHANHVNPAVQQTMNGVTATMVHSAAALVTTGLVALIVYDWIGLAFLRRGWINMDLLWAFALVLAGIWMIVSFWIF